MLPRSIPALPLLALPLLALAYLLPASSGCVTPEESLPPAAQNPAGPVFLLTRDGQVRFGENRWDLEHPTQAAKLTVLLKRLSKGTENATLVFRGESGTTFAEVKQLMNFLALADIDDYRVDLGKTQRR